MLHSLTSSADKILPTGRPDKQLADEFVQYFTQKVAKIRADLDAIECVSVAEVGERAGCRLSSAVSPRMLYSS